MEQAGFGRDPVSLRTAKLGPVRGERGAYECGGDKAPVLSVSASKGQDGRISMTITNLDPNKKADVTIEIIGGEMGKVSGRVLTTKKMNAMNTFEKPSAVKPNDFGEFSKKKGSLAVELPAKSVTLLTIG